MSEFLTEWQNFGDNIDFRPRAIFSPISPEEIAGLIATANQQDRRIRVCGSGWSYTDVATSHDYIIDVSQLNTVLAFYSAGTAWGHYPNPLPTGWVLPLGSLVLNSSPALLPAVAASSRRFAHVLSGMVLRDLIVALDDPGSDDLLIPTDPRRDQWALPTMGASAGQTISGALSTSVHGGDFGLPPIAEMVRAIELIAADGTRHWFEPAAPASITDPTLLANAFQFTRPLPVLHYNDDEFYSVLVSMGCMGVISSMIIEVVPQFGLSQRVGDSTWTAVRALINSGQLIANLPPWQGVSAGAHPTVDANGNPVQVSPRAIEIFVNPYRLSDDYYTDPSPDRHCFVTSRAACSTFDVPLPPGWCGAPNFWTPFVQGIELNIFKGNNATGVRGAVDSFMAQRCNTPSPFPVAWTVTDTFGDNPWSVANPTGNGRGLGLGIEFAVTNINGADTALVDAMLASFDAIVAANLDHKLAGVLAIRYTLTSQALMAIQNFAPYPPGLPTATAPLVCHIEVPCIQAVNDIGQPIHQGQNAVGEYAEYELESATAQHIVAFEELAVKSGVHVHWGQLTITKSQNPSQYSGFNTWQTVRHSLALTGPGAINEYRAFENDFTVRYRITPTVADWDVAGEALLPGSPTDTPDTSAFEARVFPPLAWLNSLGNIEVLATNADGNICWNQQVAPNASLSVPGKDFFPWTWVQQSDPGSAGTVLQVRFAGRIAIGFNGDGHPEAFVLNLDDGKIYHAWRNSVTDNTWHELDVLNLHPGWTAFDGSAVFVSAPDVALGGGTAWSLGPVSGVTGGPNLVVVARSAVRSPEGGETGSQIQYRDQIGALGVVVGWNGWSPLPPSPAGAVFVGDPCIGVNQSGTLEVFTRDGSGAVWRSVQSQAASNASWNGWVRIGSRQVAGDPAVGVNSDGTLELFAAGLGSTLLFIRQTPPVIGPNQATGLQSRCQANRRRRGDQASR